MRQKYMIKTGPHEPNDRLQYLIHNCRPNRAPSPFELANLFELAQSMHQNRHETRRSRLLSSYAPNEFLISFNPEEAP